MNEHTKSFASKVISTTADVLSAIPRAQQAARGARYDTARKTLVEARKYDNAPNFNDNGSVTDAFKIRSMAKDIRRRGAN